MCACMTVRHFFLHGSCWFRTSMYTFFTQDQGQVPPLPSIISGCVFGFWPSPPFTFRTFLLVSCQKSQERTGKEAGTGRTGTRMHFPSFSRFKTDISYPPPLCFSGWAGDSMVERQDKDRWDRTWLISLLSAFPLCDMCCIDIFVPFDMMLWAREQAYLHCALWAWRGINMKHAARWALLLPLRFLPCTLLPYPYLHVRFRAMRRGMAAAVNDLSHTPAWP